jgi:hypothetical protein
VKAVQPGVQPDSPSRHSRPEPGKWTKRFCVAWVSYCQMLLLKRSIVPTLPDAGDLDVVIEVRAKLFECRVQDKQERCLLIVVAGRWRLFAGSRLGASATAVAFG